MPTATTIILSGVKLPSAHTPPKVQQPPCAWQPCAKACCGNRGMTANNEIIASVRNESTEVSARLCYFRLVVYWYQNTINVGSIVATRK